MNLSLPPDHSAHSRGYGRIHRLFHISFFTHTAVAAPVAGEAHTAGITALPERRLVSVLVGNGIAHIVEEVKMYGFALEAHARLIRLLTLQSVALYLVEPAVLYEASSRSAENEGHVVVRALLPQ